MVSIQSRKLLMAVSSLQGGTNIVIIAMSIGLHVETSVHALETPAD